MHYDGDVRWRCMITQMVAKLAINHDQYCKMGFLIVTDFISFFSYWSGGFDSLESSTHVNIICLNQAWVQLLEMTIRGYWLNWMMMVMMELTNEKGLYNSQCLNLQLVVCWQVLGEYLPISNRQKRRKHGHDDNQTFSVLIESHQTNTGWYITPLMIMYQYKFYENINSEIQNFYINSIYKYH